MPGRLQQYDDQIKKFNYNVQQKLPQKKITIQEEKQIEDNFEANTTQQVFQRSRQSKLICFIFFVNRNNESLYRMAIIPQHNKSHWGKRYIEFIDVNSLKRKTLRRDRIKKAKLTNKHFEGNQSAIDFDR